MDVAALLARWPSLHPRVRVVAIGAAAFAIVAVVTMAVVTQTQRAALFAAPLHSEQLAEVQERLASWNIAFTPLADNVLVDAGRRNDLLLKLSLAGVPHAHVEDSSEMLGKVGALTPQEVIDAQTREGLAGDIALGLRGIQGVQDATVIVAPAKTGSFADEQSRDASASVRLRTSAGAALSPDAVAGVRAFVAASVPGLTARNVTIVDDSGTALDENTAGGSENDLQRSLQSALDAALGAGSAIVRVHVEYDRRAITSKDVRRSPLGSLPIGAAMQDERFAGEGKRYDRSARQLDRGSDTRESVATLESARVARISAAVVVDAARGADLAQVRALSAAALGLDRTRGDSLDVEAVAFARTRPTQKDGWWLAYGAIVPLLPTVVISIALLIALRWSREPLRMVLRSLRTAHTARAVRGIAPEAVKGALRGEPPYAAAAIISALPAATAAAVLDLYPQSERGAIIRRMQRPPSPLFPDAERFIADA
ncbi:MAG: flagellar M-ring protein FliF C-terminal domain-containing protein [Candidatus Baltobacteraceae bacterium]